MKCPAVLYCGCINLHFRCQYKRVCVIMPQTCQYCVLWNFWICQSMVTDCSVNSYFSFEKWDCASFQSYLYFFFYELPFFHLGIILHWIGVYFYYCLLFYFACGSFCWAEIFCLLLFMYLNLSTTYGFLEFHERIL